MINKLCTLYLSPKPDTIPSPAAIAKSHGKKCQIYFRVTTSPFAGMSLAREERNQEKNDGFWLLCGIFNEYIKQNIMAVLRKANFHSVDICRLMKNQSCKKRSRRKTDSNFDLF